MTTTTKINTEICVPFCLYVCGERESWNNEFACSSRQTWTPRRISCLIIHGNTGDPPTTPPRRSNVSLPFVRHFHPTTDFVGVGVVTCPFWPTFPSFWCFYSLLFTNFHRAGLPPALVWTSRRWTTTVIAVRHMPRTYPVGRTNTDVRT